MKMQNLVSPIPHCCMEKVNEYSGGAHIKNDFLILCVLRLKIQNSIKLPLTVYSSNLVGKIKQKQILKQGIQKL